MKPWKIVVLILSILAAILVILAGTIHLSRRNGGPFTSFSDFISAITDNLKSGETEVSDSPISDRMPLELGNCKRLRGKVAVVVLFVDDLESRWTHQLTEMYTRDHIEPALKFLEAEAERYGVELDMYIADIYSSDNGEDYEVKYDGIVGDLHSEDRAQDLFDQISYQIGQGSPVALDATYHYREQCDEVIFLSVLNKGGYSFTRLQNKEYDVELFEYCVLFYNTMSDDYSTSEHIHCSDTTAHEILHLFGAENLYETYSRERIARKLYPKDIMLGDYSNLKDMNMGEYTAYCIGWTHKTPECCFKPGW